MLISFDLDGVVMHSAMEIGVFRRMERVLGKFLHSQGAAAEEAGVEAAWRRLRDVSWKFMDTKDYTAAFDWAQIVPETQRQMGMDDPVDVMAMLYRAIEQGLGYVEPGARGVLEHFQKRDGRLVAITNGLKSYQMPCLDALGLTQYFEHVYTVDDTGYAKPHPKAFQAGEGLECLRMHIGDRLVEDVAGARGAGWTAVLYAPELKDQLQSLDPRERPQQIRTESLWDHDQTEQRRLVHGVSPEQMRPHAVVVHLEELPNLADVLVEEGCRSWTGT